MMIISRFRSLTKLEWLIWLGSLIAVTGSFLLADESHGLTLAASLTGATALIFVAKGDVLGQFLTVVFGLIYAVISYQFAYYGEMITYLGMTAPIAVLSIVTWLKHPFEAGKFEVKISHINPRQIYQMISLSIIVTFLFYFILKWFGTSNLMISTISITTSFVASYLLLLRSPAYALAYATNDIVLIIMWIMAAIADISYLPMVICFIIFLLNDSYAFYNWKRMRKRQADSYL
jgi:nicotinamide mononucleotide transporter PnuC